MPFTELTDALDMRRAVRTQRDRLIHDHVGLARRISIAMVRGGRAGVCREDAIAAAMLGLTEAAARYDASRGESFAAFAKKRIRGAVLDELRRGDFLPRRVRRMARRAARVRAELQMTGAAVTDEAMARALGVTPEAYRDEIAPLADAIVHSMDGGTGPMEMTGASTSVAAEVERRLALRKIVAVMQLMSTRDARILAMRYGDDLPYRVIAAELGLTTARVCQLLGRALERIREAAAPAELGG